MLKYIHKFKRVVNASRRLICREMKYEGMMNNCLYSSSTPPRLAHDWEAPDAVVVAVFTMVVVNVRVCVVMTTGRLTCLVFVCCLAVIVIGAAVTGGGVDVIVDSEVVVIV